MPDKAWKAFERRIAKSLSTERSPLSGIYGHITTSDTLHPALYVECRLRKRSALSTWWFLVRQSALKEHKVPVIAIHQLRAKHTLAVIDWRFFLKLWEAYQQLPRQLLEGLVAQGAKKGD